MKKLMAFLLAAMIPSLSACSGLFVARKRQAAPPPSGWTADSVPLGLAVLNLYAVSALADPVLATTWQFWTNRNPAAPPAPKTTRAFSSGEAVATLTFDPSVPSIRLSQRFADEPERVLVLRPVQEGVVGLDGTGRIILYSRRVNGNIVVTDNEAHFLRVYDPQEAARLGHPLGLASAF